jgi:hypothetical protein
MSAAVPETNADEKITEKKVEELSPAELMKKYILIIYFCI